jgi:hypothetical protein
MFRYNKVTKTAPFKKSYVNGWREINLLETLDNPQDRYFEVMTQGIEVIIDIHFIESFMAGLQDQQFMSSGVRLLEPLHRGSKLDKESAQKLVSFLAKHNRMATNKMPKGSLDLFMSFISYAPYMYDKITSFEESNPNTVSEVRLEKELYLRTQLEKEAKSQTESATETYENNLKMMNTKYKEMIDKNYRLGNKAIADNLKTVVVPKMEEALQMTYVEKLEQITSFEEKMLENIKGKAYPTYSFFINDFDILVKKTGDNKLKFATIYPDDIKEPSNVFLYIPAYGDEKEVKKIPKF